jgi:hypothetical protein
MISLSVTISLAQQLKNICSDRSSASKPPRHPPYRIQIPLLLIKSSTDIAPDLRSLGLRTTLVEGLQHIYAQHLHLHLQCIESEYSKTAHQLCVSMQFPQDLLDRLPETLRLTLETYRSKHENFSLRLRRITLEKVTEHLARRSGCQPDRPTQLGKSFSKVRLCPLFPSFSFVADPSFDASPSPPTPRNPSSSSAKSTTKTLTPIRPSFERSPLMSVWTTSSVESGFVLPSLVSVLLSPDNYLAYDPVALSTARSLPSITPWLTLPRSSLSFLVLFVPFGFDDATYSSKTAATVNPVPRPTPSSTRLSPPPPPRCPRARRPHSRAKVVRPRRPSRAVARARLRTASVKEEAMGTRR